MRTIGRAVRFGESDRRKRCEFRRTFLKRRVDLREPFRGLCENVVGSARCGGEVGTDAVDESRRRTAEDQAAVTFLLILLLLARQREDPRKTVHVPETMRGAEDDDVLVLRDLAEIRHHLGVRRGIKPGGRLVKKHDARFPQKRHGNRGTALLPAAQA